MIVETAVLFKRKPSPEEEDHVLKTFYEAVELNGTLGAFHVKELYKIDNRPGSYFVWFILDLAISIAIFQVLFITTNIIADELLILRATFCRRFS